MIHIVKNFINQEDLKTVQEYIKTIKFNTKDEHVPLHDNLFHKHNAPFDIHTRGEMPKEILDVFSKYSRGYWELVSEIEDIKYHPPMFSKHYIARYNVGELDGFHYAHLRPENTYGSYIYWTNDFKGGELCFENDPSCISLEPGDLIFFKESESNKHRITNLTEGVAFLSESWMSPVGTCPDPNVEYDSVYWDDWEIKGFYE